MKIFKPIVYHKDNSFDPIFFQKNNWFWFQSKVLPVLLFLIGGVILVIQVIVPLIIFKTYDTYGRPVSNSVLGKAVGLGDFEFKELKETTTGNVDINVPKYYYLSIPKLNIKEAQVETSPLTLSPDDALGHYTGSSLPGEVGNTFIYGHSVLPFFYNPRNYKTIFSTLNTLEVGDRFYIKYNNKEYKYIVESKISVRPEKVNPLGYYKPAYLNESTVTLMTCDPPGTKLKRLLVTGVMVRN